MRSMRYILKDINLEQKLQKKDCIYTIFNFKEIFRFDYV